MNPSQPQPPYTPPPYVQPPGSYGAPPRKKGMPGWAWGIIAGCGGCAFIAVPILAAILFPVFAVAREKARQAACMSNLKVLSLAAIGYSQDYDDKLPPADHWMESLQKYTPSNSSDASNPKSSDLSPSYYFRCPSIQRQGGDGYGYAFNSNLSHHSLAKLDDPRSTLLMYDSTTLTPDAADPGMSLPPKGRHSHGNNIAYGDGHVKWSHVGSKGEE